MNDLDRKAGGVAPELEDLPADRFDRCEERGQFGVRCEHEAGHGGPCSFRLTAEDVSMSVEDREAFDRALDEDVWPFDDDPPDPL